MSDFYNDLLVELECPICTNYMAPPIRQCETGHSICQSCRTKLPKCPLCQGKFTDSKNLTLEALACKMRYPCINISSGCQVQLSLQEKDIHERFCSFKGFKCAMDRCQWTGRLEEILNHWNSKKIKSKIFASFNVCHTKLKSDTYYVNLVQAYEQLFWFKCKVEKGKIFWVVQLLGNEEEAKKYFYEIEIFRPGFAKQKILFSDCCHPAAFENSILFQECSMSASIDCFRRFVGDDQLLIYYLRVLRNESEKTGKTKRDPKKNFNNNTKKEKNPRARSQGPTAHKANNEQQQKNDK